MEKKQIGVLAVQGAFAEHIAMVRKLGAEAFEIRQLPDLSVFKKKPIPPDPTQSRID